MSQSIYGTTPRPDETNMHKLREGASFYLAESDLDHTTRADGGLYAYPGRPLSQESEPHCVVIASDKTRWAFTSWPAIETYIEQIHALDEQGITDAEALDIDRFYAILDRGGIPREQARPEV